MKRLLFIGALVVSLIAVAVFMTLECAEAAGKAASGGVRPSVGVKPTGGGQLGANRGGNQGTFNRPSGPTGSVKAAQNRLTPKPSATNTGGLINGQYTGVVPPKKSLSAPVVKPQGIVGGGGNRGVNSGGSQGGIKGPSAPSGFSGGGSGGQQYAPLGVQGQGAGGSGKKPTVNPTVSRATLNQSLNSLNNIGGGGGKGGKGLNITNNDNTQQGVVQNGNKNHVVMQDKDHFHVNNIKTGDTTKGGNGNKCGGGGNDCGGGGGKGGKGHGGNHDGNNGGNQGQGQQQGQNQGQEQNQTQNNKQTQTNQQTNTQKTDVKNTNSNTNCNSSNSEANSSVNDSGNSTIKDSGNSQATGIGYGGAGGSVKDSGNSNVNVKTGDTNVNNNTTVKTGDTKATGGSVKDSGNSSNTNANSLIGGDQVVNVNGAGGGGDSTSIATVLAALLANQGQIGGGGTVQPAPPSNVLTPVDTGGSAAAAAASGNGCNNCNQQPVEEYYHPPGANAYATYLIPPDLMYYPNKRQDYVIYDNRVAAKTKEEVTPPPKPVCGPPCEVVRKAFPSGQPIYTFNVNRKKAKCEGYLHHHKYSTEELKGWTEVTVSFVETEELKYGGRPIACTGIFKAYLSPDKFTRQIYVPLNCEDAVAGANKEGCKDCGVTITGLNKEDWKQISKKLKNGETLLEPAFQVTIRN